MGSSFGILETARRGMNTQQSAISITAHNIANANNPYYSRQRVNMKATNAFPSPGLNQPYMSGQIGTGVKVDSVQRIREDFLDVQFRGENNKLGYYKAKSEALSKMEGIMNEPSETGLSKTVNQFWQSLQDLAVNPENGGAKSVVIERAKAVADTFNYITDSLKGIQKDIGAQLDNSVDTVNSLLTQIQNLNKQIASVEPHGLVPNDLYDERTRLIDELSSYADIQVKYESSGTTASAVAEGKATITLIGADGTPITPPLVNGANVDEKPQMLEVVKDAAGAITGIKVGANGPEVSVDNLSKGKLKGLIESLGYKDGQTGEYPEMLEKLKVIATALQDALKTPGGASIFTVDAAGKVSVNETDLDAFLKTASSAETKDWATSIADAINAPIGDPANPTGANFNQSYQEIIGDMGVRAQEAERLTKNTIVLMLSVDNNRKSVSAVSTDEEMTNLITFQHAYSAAARTVTAIDEMLETIINKMGLVGR